MKYIELLREWAEEWKEHCDRLPGDYAIGQGDAMRSLLHKLDDLESLEGTENWRKS